MAPRSSWKGYLKLSLISVPVKAFTANNTSETVRLNQLHAGCNSRVKYLKVCPEHGELKPNMIVSAYEYAKDQYVEVDQDELSKIRPESDRAVSMRGFIPEDEIDPIYLAGKTYYLLPDGLAGNKPYALLRTGMEKKDLVAIGQIVISGREQLVLLRPVENLIVMSILHISKKIKSIEQFTDEFEDQELTKEELKLTDTLINASVIEDFDFTEYEDEYTNQLTKLIQMKIDGEEIIQAPDYEEPRIINLMEALKQSVAEAKSRSKKMAPSASKKKKTSAAKKKTVRRKKSG